MSHAPPVPDAQRAPWPAHPAPIQHDAKSAAAETTAEATPAAPRQLTKRGMGVGAAAIGSAAVAAALLYVNYGRRR